MSTRSNTGCYRCKTWRKKCDEMKPMCLRCKNSGAECIYEYSQGPGKTAKLKTKPGPRPASERTLRLQPHPPSSTIISGSADNTRNCKELPEYSPEAMLHQPPNTRTEQNDLLRYQLALPTISSRALIPCNVRTGTLLPILRSSPDPPIAPDSTPYENSLRALRNPSHTVPPLRIQSYASLPSAQKIDFPPYKSESHDTLRNYRSSPPDIHAQISAPNALDEEEDIEGVKEVFCSSLISLNGSSEDNLLSFILQSYGQWIHVAVFEPLRIIHQTRENVISEFSQSPASRSRLLLTARLMRALTKSWAFNEAEKQVLGLLRGEVLRNMANSAQRESPSAEKEQERAYIALNHTLEVVSLQINSVSLSFTLNILQTAMPVFLIACSSAWFPQMLDILLEGGVNLKHFVAADVAMSVTTGRPLLCRYYAPWSLEICGRIMEKTENQGAQWLLGIPDQFILLFGYIDSLKKDAEASRTIVDSRQLLQIEDDVRRVHVLLPKSHDPSLVIARATVQECWREAVVLYTYMVLGGAHALDPRVVKAQLGFMRLVKGIKPGRNPDAFLVIPMIIAGVASTKISHRRILTSRILSMPECSHPNTAGNEVLLTLREVWATTELERRAPQWDDLREACKRVTGI